MKLLQIAVSICMFMVLCNSTEKKIDPSIIEDKIDEIRKALETDYLKFGHMIGTFERQRNTLEKYMEHCEVGPIKNAKSLNSFLKQENLSPDKSTIEKQLKQLDKLYNDYKNKKIIFQDEHEQLTEQEVKNMKDEKEKETEKLKNEIEIEIKKLKNEIEQLKREKDTAVDIIKTLKTDITDFKNEKQKEIIYLKALHNEKLSDALHDVHLHYIIGIIIGLIVILGLNGYFCCCLKPDLTKVKNENKDLDIEAYGELSLSQVPIAPGMLAATQGEDSISFCMAIGPMPEMLTTEEYVISAQQITKITTGGEKVQEEEENTILSVDLKYIPKIGEYIVATSNFQAFSVPMGRPRNIKVTDMPMNVHKFNKKGDALVDSEKYGTLLFKILKRDFNKIKSSQNKTQTVRQRSQSLQEIVLKPNSDTTEEIISGPPSKETETIEEIIMMCESNPENIGDKNIKVEDENILDEFKDECENRFMRNDDDLLQPQNAKAKRKRKKHSTGNNNVMQKKVKTQTTSDHNEDEMVGNMQKDYKILHD